MRGGVFNWRAGWVLLVVALTVGSAPAAAPAQYTAPPPEPGFTYIFDGTATGSDASFDKWLAANGATATTLDPALGAMDPNNSGFGMMWYPVRPLGDVVVRLDYMVENTPTATPNGGVMVRFPELRYTGTTQQVLSQKPTGYNYDLCPGAAPSFCGLPQPAPSTTYSWAGGDGPYPPASDAFSPPFRYSGAYCGRSGTHNVTGLDGVNPVTASNFADNHQHWMSVFCGHEIQINDSLQNPGTDPIKTGSAYGFQNLNAKQSGTDERQTKGVWHTMEIRMVGQQYTVLIDGRQVNQFDNSVPKIASRNFDPPTQARQFATGYFGLQTHGGTDRVFYREVRVKQLSERSTPQNRVAPKVAGSGEVGENLTCVPRAWRNVRTPSLEMEWYRANRIGPEHPRYRAPSQIDLWSSTEPADPRYGTQPLPVLGRLKLGDGRHYRPTAEDVGKLVYCQVSATNDGATVWETASAPTIVAEKVQPAASADRPLRATCPAR
jgi:hypothetical protein